MKIIIAALALVLVSTPPVRAAASKAHATAKLAGLDGKALGSVDFAQTNHGVMITLDLHGLPPGAHGVHLHTSANCSAKTKFTSAGPHTNFDPPKLHGFLTKGGPHPGDLPNQFAAADGTLHASLLSNSFSLGNGKKTIFDRDGASIIVDARADDYTSQPDGHAGERIACGVIIRTAGPMARRAGSRRKHA